MLVSPSLAMAWIGLAWPYLKRSLAYSLRQKNNNTKSDALSDDQNTHVKCT